ncbi:tRNA preQ1(34) S-adenosylmethionine ribosyltransferase-isomerase QueA [Chloroflexota bacterium]
MKTSDFDYTLPAELIAQIPLEPRDRSRLLVLPRQGGSLEHRRFYEIGDYLRGGDVLVFNDSRVIPARLHGMKLDSGGGVEILLLRRLEANIWEALVKPGKKLHTGSKVYITNDASKDEEKGKGVYGEVVAEGEAGVRTISFDDETLLAGLGQVALPPYIHMPLSRAERYQTVYSKIEGSVAAPTAGLHFTPELLAGIEKMGVQCLFTTLHVGLDTFRPVREEDPREHKIHREYAVLDAKVARQLSAARREGRRIIAVGTTTVRILEQMGQVGDPCQLEPFAGWVELFIMPGHEFRMVDGLITNFHLPRSTLLMLVSAFAGINAIRNAYQEAITEKYRFYSFGDAMLII